MNDAAPAAEKSPRSGLALRFLGWLLLLALLAGLGAGGWWLWQRLEGTTSTLEAQDALIRRLSQQLRTVEADSQELSRQFDHMDDSAQRTAQTLTQMQTQQLSALKGIEELDATLKGGRGRFQLAAVEELLLLAHDRVALAGDVASAVLALELADSRLAALADARLLPVREALSAERLALLAAPKPDFAGAALALGSLLDRANSLPLRSRSPQQFDPTPESPAEPPALPADAEWPARLWAGAKAALGTVFRIQRESRPVDRLLPPQQEVLIHTILQLKLEGARLALLRQEPTSFADLLDDTLAWLEQYYQAGDARVLAVKAELQRLRALELKPKLPQPQKALERLRAVTR